MFSYCEQTYQPDILAIIVIKQYTKLLQNKLEQLKNAVTEIK